MICTQFGTEVKIVSGNMKTGRAEIEYPDGVRRYVDVINLRADGGLNEIEKVIEDSRCEYCKGTGRDPMSDNVNWLPCPACR